MVLLGLCDVSFKKMVFFFIKQKSLIDYACSVKTTGYWPWSWSLFVCLWSSTPSRVMNMWKKNLHMVNNPYVIKKSSYFLIWSSLAWSLLWAGFTRHTIFRFSSLFFFTMSRNKVWSFSYSSSQVLNTSKQAIMIYNQWKCMLIWPQEWLEKMNTLLKSSVCCMLPFQILHGWCASVFWYPKPSKIVK